MHNEYEENVKRYQQQQSLMGMVRSGSDDQAYGSLSQLQKKGSALSNLVNNHGLERSKTKKVFLNQGLSPHNKL